MSNLLVVVSRRYNYAEFWYTLKVFKKRGHNFDVVSSELVIRQENRKGHSNKLDRTIDDVRTMDGFDGLVVISGNPEDTEIFWYHKGCKALVQESRDKHLVIAALCSAVPTIRYAARGKLVSVYPLFKSIELLEMSGAIVNQASLSTDDNIVTAENEQMTTMWATNICDVLEGKPPTYTLYPSGFKRKIITFGNDPDLNRIKDVMKRTGKRGFK